MNNLCGILPAAEEPSPLAGVFWHLEELIFELHGECKVNCKRGMQTASPISTLFWLELHWSSVKMRLGEEKQDKVSLSSGFA